MQALFSLVSSQKFYLFIFKRRRGDRNLPMQNEEDDLEKELSKLGEENNESSESSGSEDDVSGGDDDGSEAVLKGNKTNDLFGPNVSSIWNSRKRLGGGRRRSRIQIETDELLGNASDAYIKGDFENAISILSEVSQSIHKNN